VDALAGALQCRAVKLRRLILSDNKIHRLARLARALQANTRLRLLDVADNVIDDAAALELAQSLSVNRTLRRLHLEANNLTNTSGRAFLSALTQNPASALRQLVLQDEVRCGAKNKISASIVACIGAKLNARTAADAARR
jgi:Ran GTPase-activating protein (RanGAP) involved in mRNA processing and transport